MRGGGSSVLIGLVACSTVSSPRPAPPASAQPAAPAEHQPAPSAEDVPSPPPARSHFETATLHELPTDAACIVRGRSSARLATALDAAPWGAVRGDVTAYLMAGSLSAAWVQVEATDATFVGAVPVEDLALAVDDIAVAGGYIALLDGFAKQAGKSLTIEVNAEGLAIRPRWEDAIATLVKVHAPEDVAVLPCASLSWGTNIKPIVTLFGGSSRTGRVRGEDPLALAATPGGPALIDVDPRMAPVVIVLATTRRAARVAIRPTIDPSLAWLIVGWVDRKRVDIAPSKPKKATGDGSSQVSGGSAGLAAAPLPTLAVVTCAAPVRLWADIEGSATVVGQTRPDVALSVGTGDGPWVSVHNDFSGGRPRAETRLFARTDDLRTCTAAR